MRAYGETFGLPVLVTRCSNNYGPFQFPEKLIPFFITLLRENKPVPVYGDGMNVRDWIHADDHSRAIEAVLLRGRPGEIYNIGGGNERTNIEITKLLIAAMGKDERSMKFVPDRPGHDRRYAIDDAKILAELGVVRGSRSRRAARHGALVHRQRTVVAGGPVRRVPVVLRSLVRQQGPRLR